MSQCHQLPRRHRERHISSARHQHVHQAFPQPRPYVNSHVPASAPGHRHTRRHQDGTSALRSLPVGHLGNASLEARQEIRLSTSHRLERHRRPEETRIAEIVDLDAVHVVALADLLGDTEEIVAHLLLLEVQCRPAIARITVGILLAVVRLAHQVFGMLSLPLRQEPRREAVVDIVDSMRPEHLKVLLVTPFDNQLQAILPRRPQHPHVVACVDRILGRAADRIHKVVPSLSHIRVVLIERGHQCAEENRVNLRVQGRHDASGQERVRARELGDE